MSSPAKYAWLTFLLATAVVASAQTFTTLLSFKELEGFYVEAALVEGSDGNFYGTAPAGGNTACGGCGTVFKITPHGVLTVLYRFCSQPNCADGAKPSAGLIQAADGNFYGTTFAGGIGGNGTRCSDGVVPGCGTVFRITPKGKLTTLHSFCIEIGCPDDGKPLGALVEANRKFYGTTSGANSFGTVFEITTDGTLTTLHRFGLSDGASPASSEGLAQGFDGNFYGTTTTGGTYDGGTVFRITPGGELTTLYNFCAVTPECGDGMDPLSGLTRGIDGTFFGTTLSGGAHKEGTVFKITSQGELTTVYNFCAVLPNCADGAVAYGGVIQGSDRQLYGTTYSNGPNGVGTIYKVTPSGELTTLYSFCSQANCADGAFPFAGLLQARNGKFYGTTCCQGASNLGTLFELDAGLSDPHSFVRSQLH